MDNRLLGRSGIEVSPLGFGCWAIGGPFHDTEGNPLGWGEVDDAESTRAIHHALDNGITFFDTADVYGCGHSERVLGKALGAHRGDVVIATKWGNTFDEQSRTMHGPDASVTYLQQAVRGSLDRLGTDYLDLYQLHVQPDTKDEAIALREACEQLVDEGLIRAYAWSTDDPQRAALFAEGAHCTAVQHQLNVVEDAPEMLELCDRLGLGSVNRGPLAMGLLAGRDASRPTSQSDIRSVAPGWLRWFKDGVPTPEFTAVVAAIRDVLTSDGRTLAQGALAWIWARSPRTIPIPGFRTVEQAGQNAAASAYGPLRPEQLAEVKYALRTLDDRK
ncbi:aldo/keto reductase [Flindersiella endophytica]